MEKLRWGNTITVPKYGGFGNVLKVGMSYLDLCDLFGLISPKLCMLLEVCMKHIMTMTMNLFSNLHYIHILQNTTFN